MVFFNITSDTFIIYKTFMRFSGIWPLSRGKASTAIFSFFVMLEIMTIISCLIDSCGNWSARNLADLGIVYTWVAACMILRFTLRFNGNKMIPLIESTIDDWSSITDPEERAIMKRHDKSGFLVIVTKNVGTTVLLLGREVLKVIFPTQFPAQNQRVSACNEHIIWTIMRKFSSKTVTFVDHVMINLVMTLIWSFALHLSGQCKILKKRFQEFLLIKNKKESRQVFRRLVDRHNQLLDLSGSLEDSFWFFIGLHIIRTQILMCLMASRLGYAIKAAEFMKILNTSKNMVALVFLPIIYYYAGDRLTESFEEIGDVFTQCNWYDLPKESITNFSIVIARTRKPPKLTLWKFHKLNLSNLKHTLHALYSYVSLIVSIQTE